MTSALAIEKCVNHPQCNVECVYFGQNVTKVCKLCANQHPKHVLSIDNFANIIMEAYTKLQKAQKQSLARHDELTSIMKTFKNEYSRQQNQIIRQVLKMIQQENKKFKEEHSVIEKLKKKLHDLSKLLQYFEAFKDKQLMDIKLNMSSQQGLKVFLRKYSAYTCVIKKKNFQEYLKIERQIVERTQKLRQLDSKSIAKHIHEYLFSQPTNKDKQSLENNCIRIQPSPKKNLLL